MKEPIKIYYFSPYDILRPRTNQVLDMRFCEGFAQNGCEVEMMVPYVFRRDNIKKSELFKIYEVEQKFKTRYLPTLFFSDVNGKWHFFIISILNTFRFVRIIFQCTSGKKVILSRSPALLLSFLLMRKILGGKNLKIICWAHEIQGKITLRWVYKNADSIIGTNSMITDDLKKNYKIDEKKLGISLNPISEYQLHHRISKAEARKHLSIQTDKPLIVYTGKLSIGQQEAEYILQSAAQLNKYHFILTGGKPIVVKHYQDWCVKKDIQNVYFTGYIHDYSQIKYYQFAADVLISYYTPKEHNVRYNFPSKICEYMLTGNPMVTPDYPATSDILNERNTIFVKPENMEELAAGIKKAVDEKEFSGKIAERAFLDVQEITFKKRAKILLEFIENL